MDHHVDVMDKAYQAFTDSLMAYITAKQTSSDQNKDVTDKALKTVKEKYESFKDACDNADDNIQIARNKLFMEHGGSIQNLVSFADALVGESSTGNASATSDGVTLTMKENPIMEYCGCAEDLLHVDDPFYELPIGNYINYLELKSAGKAKLTDVETSGGSGSGKENSLV